MKTAPHPIHAPVLNWCHVGVRFGDGANELVAARDVSLSVHAGECLALVGESGSGKTQSMLAPFGLSKGARLCGHAWFDDIDLCAADELARNARRGRLAGFVFQDLLSSLAPHLTIGEQLTETMMAHERIGRDEANARAVALLARVRLVRPDQCLQSYPHQLSGGMRQRVAIAMAVATRPRLLIADEPTTALDTAVQSEVLKLLSELQREHGLAMVFISHDLAVVAQVADRIAVMHQGIVVETGLVHDVLRKPQHTHTRALVAAAQGTHDAVVEIDQRGPPLLTVDRFNVSYARRSRSFTWPWRRPAPLDVVRNARFELSAGRTLGIVGESGSGKSTLARTLLGLGAGVGSGKVSWRGHELNLVARRTLNQRLDMQMVFQDSAASLDPTHPIASSIAEAARQRHPEWSNERVRERISELLLACGLPLQMSQRWPDELSGGQAQRAAIARALAAEPSILVCDEAVSALDATVRLQVIELLRHLRSSRRLAMLFVTHDFMTVRRLCDSVMVMCQGEIVEYGVTAEVLDAPKHIYTQKLLQSAPLLPVL
jgi:peptide/nickel transport system ATP-binding protein